MPGQTVSCGVVGVSVWGEQSTGRVWRLCPAWGTARKVNLVRTVGVGVSEKTAEKMLDAPGSVAIVVAATESAVKGGTMRGNLGLVAVLALGAWSGVANAQTPEFKPIDAGQLVVAPADAAASVTGNTTFAGIRRLGRIVADTIEDNGFVKTINNLLGRRATAAVPQAGFSALPDPTAYQSTRYRSQFVPMQPIASTFGQTPTGIVPTNTFTGRR
jgi:hypothetical protein